MTGKNLVELVLLRKHHNPALVKSMLNARIRDIYSKRSGVKGFREVDGTKDSYIAIEKDVAIIESVEIDGVRIDRFCGDPGMLDSVTIP
jgi:hypothetical protein